MRSPKRASRLPGAGGLSAALDAQVHAVDPQRAFFGGGEHLHIAEGVAQAAVLQHVDHPALDVLRICAFFKGEVARKFQKRHFAVVDALGVEGDAAALALAKDLLQADHRQHACADDIPQHISCAHAGELVGVPHQDEPRALGQGF